MKPKLWDGANAVGEAKARELARLDAPYLTASGPGFTAKKAGGFLEVTGAPPEQPAPAFDGWYSCSDATIPPVQVVAAARPRGQFKPRGTSAIATALAGYSLGLVADGRGHALVFLRGEDSGVLRKTDVMRTRNGGRSMSTLYTTTHNADVAETAYAYFAKFDAAIIDGKSTVTEVCATFVSSGGVMRQRPQVRLATLSAGVVSHSALHLPRVEYPERDYTYPELLVLVPGNYVVAYAPADPALPGVLAVTRDAGKTWAEYSTDAFFPQAYVAPYKTEAGLAQQYPTESAEKIRARYLAQTAVKKRTNSAHLALRAISARRVLVFAEYPADSDTTAYSVSVFDLERGAVLAQRVSTSLRALAVAPLGQDEWVLIEDARNYEDGRTYGKLYLSTTRDGGLTYTATVPAPTGMDALSATVPKRARDAHSPVKTYFHNRTAGVRTLYCTEDAFDTYEAVATVSPPGAAATKRDYWTVQWIGNPTSPAPMDPRFPWRCDSRVAVPDWWKDGLDI